MPLGAFSFETAVVDKCFLAIQPLYSFEVDSSSVLFGALFLQQYELYVEYDYSGDGTPITLSLTPTPSFSFDGAYLGSAVYADGTSPFP